LGEGSKIGIAHPLDVFTRGDEDTTATSHDSGYTSYWDDTYFPHIGTFRTCTGERELSLEWLAADIAKRAGITNITSAKHESGTVTFTHAGWAVDTDHGNTFHKEQDAIIHMYRTSGTEVGVCTIEENHSGSSHGHIVSVDDTDVNLYSVTSGTSVSLSESIPHGREAGDTKLTFSIYDNTIKVYMSDILVWAFWIDTQEEGTCLVSNGNATIEVDWSVVDNRIDNFICDMGSPGIQSLAELIGEKEIYFQHDEGTLHLFVDHVTINAAAPYDLLTDGEDTDTESKLTTRLRMEGIDIYELANYTLLKQYGNLFDVAQSQEINSVGELEKEAQRVIDEAGKSINETSLGGAADPRVEPDDIFRITFTGSDRTATRNIIVKDISFTMAVDDNNAIFDMEAGGIDV
jgi:hypothetical protein